MSNKLLSRADLLPTGGRILCALSGGPDSVALTHALCALTPERGLTVAAAHFSHGLRPEAAEAETDLCRNLCRSLDIPLFCGSGDTAAYAAAQGCTTEEAARHLRYAFLQETAQAWQADAIATGHHRGDQAETVLFHLARGSGMTGLRGIPPRRDNIIRPMLDTGREEILSYLAAYGLSYAEDTTNADVALSRNRIRHRVLPQLEQVHPGAEANIAACARRLAIDDDCLHALARQALEEDGASGIECTRLLALHPALQARVLRILYAEAACGGALSQTHLDALLQLVIRGGSGRVALPGELWGLLEYGRLTIGPLPEQRPPFEPVWLQPEDRVTVGEWELCFTTAPEASGFVFDREKVTFPVLVRPRQEGDRIPIGKIGHQSVKKLLIACKIPAHTRDSLPILCDNKGVLAVANLRMDVTRSGNAKKEKIALVCRRKEI